MSLRSSTVRALSTVAPADQASVRDASACAHCGQELTSAQKKDHGDFCCAGCKTVYGLIQESGLGRYYDLKSCTIAPPSEARGTQATYVWLDPILEAAPTLADGSLRTLRLDVQGVHCAACVWLIEQVFGRHPAGRQLRLNPALGSVEILWDTDRGDLREFMREVEAFGYRFGPSRKESSSSSRALLIRMGVSIAAALNVMSFSLAYYFGLNGLDGPVYGLFGRLSLVLATIVVAYGGWPFLSTAWRGVRRGIVHLDLPIAVGMLLAYAGSAWTYATVGPEHAYFDTITIFVALMLVGRWMQERVLERNRNALLASAGVADLYSRRFAAEQLQTVSVGEIRMADELWIAPGDLVPVQGVLLRSEADVSLDWITGESAPVHCAPGATIPAGAFNAGDRGFRLTATEDFVSSRLNDLVGGERDDVFDRTGGRWWHRVATVYVGVVLTLATLGFGLWIGNGAQRAVEVAVAVLVITCPCALGLAVPLSRELGQAWLRRRGVLIREGDFFDRAQHVDTVVFDKTGTVTRGQLRLTDDARRNLRGLDDSERGVLTAMTARSSHPVSRCVHAALTLRDARSIGDAPLIDADATREVTGRGLELEYGEHVYRFGRGDFAGDGSDGVRAVFSVDGTPLATLDLEEDLKPDVADEVAALVRDGYDVRLFSGDRPERVSEVASRIGIAEENAVGALDPEAKAARVHGLGDGVMMVGDGLNDSPSFDKALCRATPAVDHAVMPAKSDFYFLGDGIEAVRRALRVARRLRRVQRDNLIFAAIYNLGAVALALAGLVNPIVAAVLMPISSLTVVGMTTVRLSGSESR